MCNFIPYPLYLHEVVVKYPVFLCAAHRPTVASVE